MQRLVLTIVSLVLATASLTACSPKYEPAQIEQGELGMWKRAIYQCSFDYSGADRGTDWSDNGKFYSLGEAWASDESSRRSCITSYSFKEQDEDLDPTSREISAANVITGYSDIYARVYGDDVKALLKKIYATCAAQNFSIDEEWEGWTTEGTFVETAAALRLCPDHPDAAHARAKIQQNGFGALLHDE